MSLGVVLSLPSVRDKSRGHARPSRGGFESVWTTEFPDRSAVMSLAAIALQTSRITLGTAIAHAFGRPDRRGAGHDRRVL